ncbi:aminoglycoside phosphotransferase [Shewanella sp. NFH-SH190041]|uniref:aminoglycoside phosphotransferase family protein n=1 Tax=Shewanella sp. NFH-SH190041 TaxID=2950245 RepID=UPI0021C2A5CB|nr:aminoglycoside phosphotransferase family protein [Shewanella sp. NFH-SH190041]BDM64759.1 aminoglycoside phosphotransferase [Shewanella sp. NFH-SH190041]
MSELKLTSGAVNSEVEAATDKAVPPRVCSQGNPSGLVLGDLYAEHVGLAVFAASARLYAQMKLQVLTDGLSNSNYVVDGRWVLRINRQVDALGVGRAAEVACWQQACAAGLAPVLLAVSSERQYYLSDYLPQKEVSSPARESLQLDPSQQKAQQQKLSQSERRQLELAAENGLSHASFEKDIRQGIIAPVVQLPARLSQLVNRFFNQSAGQVIGQSAAIDSLPHSYPAGLTPRVEALLTLLLSLARLPLPEHKITATVQWQQYHDALIKLQSLESTSTLVVGGIKEPIEQFAADRDKAVNTRKKAVQQGAAQLLQCSAQIAHWLTLMAQGENGWEQFCHRDLNPANLLRCGDSLCCIDFEYACAGGPLAELATVLATHGLSDAECLALSAGYIHALGLPDCNAMQIDAAVNIYWLFSACWALLQASAAITSESNAIHASEATVENINSADEYLAWFALSVSYLEGTD